MSSSIDPIVMGQIVWIFLIVATLVLMFSIPHPSVSSERRVQHQKYEQCTFALSKMRSGADSISFYKLNTDCLTSKDTTAQ
jgi:hypothetical protein